MFACLYLYVSYNYLLLFFFFTTRRPPRSTRTEPLFPSPTLFLSTIALPVVRAALDIPVVGTVPAVNPAALASKSRVIGVLGTPATVRQPYVDRLANEFGADCIVLRHGSSDLVDSAQAKLHGQKPGPPAPHPALEGFFQQK